MAVNDVWEVGISLQIGSLPTMVVPHFVETVSVVPDPPKLAATAIAQAIHASGWMTALLACISEDVELLSIYVRKVSPTADVPLLYIVGTTPPVAGTNAAPADPSQVAALISLYTARMDRAGRGRMYIPGTPAGGNNEGLVIAVYLAELQAFCDVVPLTLVMIGPDAGEIRQCVWSRGQEEANVVLQATPRTNLATIRGRRQRPGIA